jgi:hypothetical protein
MIRCRGEIRRLQLPRLDSFRFFALGLPAMWSLVIQARNLRLTQSVHVSEAFNCVSMESQR